MKFENKIILGILIFSIFVFVVAVSSLYTQMQISEGNACSCLIPLPLFIPFVASIGLFIGTLIFYLLYTPKQTKINREVFLKLFDYKEREIIRKLFENKGKLSQSRLVQETNLSKVQVFRILERLSQKRVISKEPKGKTNIVELDKDIYESFS